LEEKNLSKKERKRLRLLEEERLIRGITLRSVEDKISWEKIYDNCRHGEYYHAAPEIENVKLEINYLDWRGCRNVGIFHGKAHEIIFRTRKNKAIFNILLNVIKGQIFRKEGLKTQKQESDDDTTQILSLRPKEEEKTEIMKIRQNYADLWKAIEALKEPLKTLESKAVK